MQDPFSTDAFSVYQLTSAINVLPNRYGRVREMNIFPVLPRRSRTIVLEEKHGVLTLIPSAPVGSPGHQNISGKRKVRTFVIPHFPLDDVILPDEYQDIRAFGSESQLRELADLVNERLQSMKDKHDITLENLRMGAIKGQIPDADGSLIYDLFTEFGITQKTVNFALDTDSTDVRGKCFEVKRHVEDNLQGEIMNGVHCLCSGSFLDKLINHPNVYETFLYQSSSQTRDDVRKNFQFGGITFEEYRGSVEGTEGLQNFIADGEAHFFPRGTSNTFYTAVAPADFNETANTRGRLYYAKQTPRKFDRGVDLHTQSNPLPMCARPGVLVKGKAT